MARGALRGAMVAWLGLITLQTVTGKGSGKVAGVFDVLNAGIQHAMSPDVPLIPDHSAAASASGSGSAAAATAGTGGTLTPVGLAADHVAGIGPKAQAADSISPLIDHLNDLYPQNAPKKK